MRKEIFAKKQNTRLVNFMSNLAFNQRIITKESIEAAEKDLIEKIEESLKVPTSECRDYREFSKELREKLVNGTL